MSTLRFLFTVDHVLIALRRGERDIAADLQAPDDDLARVFDALDDRPDAVSFMRFGYSGATDATGTRLAAWVGKSRSVREVIVHHNKFGASSFLAMAKSLHTNKSLRVLVMNGNPVDNIDRAAVAAAFEDALAHNPVRPDGSIWYVFDLACLISHRRTRVSGSSVDEEDE